MAQSSSFRVMFLGHRRLVVVERRGGMQAGHRGALSSVTNRCFEPAAI
jgi:hypothetical protein